MRMLEELPIRSMQSKYYEVMRMPKKLSIFLTQLKNCVVPGTRMPDELSILVILSKHYEVPSMRIPEELLIFFFMKLQAFTVKLY